MNFEFCSIMMNSLCNNNNNNGANDNNNNKQVHHLRFKCPFEFSSKKKSCPTRERIESESLVGKVCCEKIMKIWHMFRVITKGQKMLPPKKRKKHMVRMRMNTGKKTIVAITIWIVIYLLDCLDFTKVFLILSKFQLLTVSPTLKL